MEHGHQEEVSIAECLIKAPGSKHGCSTESAYSFCVCFSKASHHICDTLQRFPFLRLSSTKVVPRPRYEHPFHKHRDPHIQEPKGERDAAI